MESLHVEMSGLLKELRCPYEEVVSGILKGIVLTTRDHLKFLCMQSNRAAHFKHCVGRRDV